MSAMSIDFFFQSEACSPCPLQLVKTRLILFYRMVSASVLILRVTKQLRVSCWTRVYTVVLVTKNNIFVRQIVNYNPVISITVRDRLHLNESCLQLKSLFPKPDKSTFGENLVFNIIVQYYIRASNRVKFRSRNSHKYFFPLIFFLPIDVYKFCQRNLFYSKVPKVYLSGFGIELFNCWCM